jgi:mRNA deadenylase 3'-5' endonuclease subunit Ccr4
VYINTIALTDYLYHPVQYVGPIKDVIEIEIQLLHGKTRLKRKNNGHHEKENINGYNYQS